jgi:hypothetical protein
MEGKKPVFWTAVHHFWLARRNQADEQVARGTRDQGTRGAVTGGGHLDGFLLTLSEHLTDAGAPPGSVVTGRRSTVVPGFFRPTKEWDLLVVVDGQLLACVELKSQVGSFGNNFNNRVEEAIGNATDLRTAFRDGAFGAHQAPWLGYLFLLQDCPPVHAKTRTAAPWFPVFDELEGASYAQRYAELCRRLEAEGLYDATCFLLSADAAAEEIPNYSEPIPECSGDRFLRLLTEHVAAVLD